MAVILVEQVRIEKVSGRSSKTRMDWNI